MNQVQPPGLPSRAHSREGQAPVLEMAGVGLAVDGIDILHDVSLELRAGEVCGLLGPNGAGKSTTVAAALGLLPRNAGTIAVFGMDPASHRDQIQARVGILPERQPSLECMTAGEYLQYSARLSLRELSRPDVSRYLEVVGLEPALQSPIGVYSRGMQKQLAIARALIGDPSLLLLDNPTDGLDPHARRQVLELLRDLATHRGVAVLLCTHRLDDVEQLCARIGILLQGRIVQEGTLAELRATLSASGAGRHRDGMICIGPMPNGGPGSHDLLAAGWPTMELLDDSPRLEELYHELIRCSDRHSTSLPA